MAFATRQFLLLRVGDQSCGIPVDSIREIVHRAALVSAPAQPPILDGFLNLRGAAIPVISMRRLFGQPEGPPNLYTPLIVIDTGSGSVALEADEAESVTKIRAEDMRALPPDASPEHCAEALATVDSRQILLLSCPRLLFEQEKQCLASLQATMAIRLLQLADLAG